MHRRQILKLSASMAVGASVIGACTPGAEPNSSKDTAATRSKTVSTRFSKAFHVEHPFICAGMGFICDKVDLCIAVSKAGGVGALAGSLLSPPELKEKILAIRAATGNPFHINFLTLFPHDTQIDVCIEEKVPAVSFHFGLPTPETMSRLQAAGVSVWAQIGTVAAARDAKSAGMDAIIVQGGEAGGHTYDGMSIMALLPAVREVVGDTLVFAAGGISDGRTAAAALAAGADAVWVGTRMVATQEANAHDDYKKKLVKAEGEQTIVTGVYGPEFPAFNPMRVIRNNVVNEWHDKIGEIPKDRSTMKTIGMTKFAGQDKPVKPFDSIIPVPETTGDLNQMPMLAGQGVGLVKSIEPAGKVIADMMHDAALAIGGLASSKVN